VPQVAVQIFAGCVKKHCPRTSQNSPWSSYQRTVKDRRPRLSGSLLYSIRQGSPLCDFALNAIGVWSSNTSRWRVRALTGLVLSLVELLTP